VLSTSPQGQRVSTGFDALDRVLGGLYWGDNVVLALDGVSPEPFYRAIARQDGVFVAKTTVSLGGPTTYRDIAGMVVLEAGPQPADLLREVHRTSQARGHRLFLFDSMDAMVQAWGVNRTRDFFARCCPMLLEFGAIAYWSMTVAGTPASVQETVHAVTQCVLRVDDRSLRVAKAEGRDDSVLGTVLHWHQEGGRAILAPAEVSGRVAASLRSVRRTRKLSQHELGDLAGVTASAISQVERGDRSLSLATLVRLSAALGVTIDDLLRGEDPGTYRIGRRTDDPQDGFEHTVALLGGADLHIDLVHLGPREAGTPVAGIPPGQGVVAVASGLVQVQVGGQTPAVRHGEVLVADSTLVAGWRNLGQAEAELFWIVSSA
jgi:transcriptional regulator with XRE-family HTH domain